MSASTTEQTHDEVARDVGVGGWATWDCQSHLRCCARDSRSGATADTNPRTPFSGPGAGATPLQRTSPKTARS